MSDMGPNFLNRLKEAEVSERFKLMTNQLESVIRELLAFPETDPMGHKLSFFEIGLDSILAVKLKSELQSLFGNAIEIQSVDIFDNASIVKLSEFLLNKLNIDAA